MTQNDIKDKKIPIPKFAIVEFKGHRRHTFLNNKNFEIERGTKVLLQLDSGLDLGKVVCTKNSIDSKNGNQNSSEKIFSIIKIADKADLDKEFLNRYDESDIIYKANELAQDFEINMKIVDAEWQFDRQKLTIFFTAPERVDFRELVKELARSFKTRIELRQINSREETRRLGCGIGCCGQTICCTSFLFDFNQITIEHAKLQQLSNNVTKLSGNCDRLKCCLLFEYEHYEEEMKNYPELHSTIELEDGNAVLNKIDIFQKNVSLYSLTQKKTIILSQEDLQKYIDKGKVIPPKDMDEKLSAVDNNIIAEN